MPRSSLVLARAGQLSSRTQKRIDLRHHLEGVGHVQDISLAAGPAAIGIEIDGAPLANESPTHGVRLLAVAARGQPLGMAWRGPGLSHLVEVAHEAQRRLVLAGELDQGFAAAERRFGLVH